MFGRGTSLPPATAAGSSAAEPARHASSAEPAVPRRPAFLDTVPSAARSLAAVRTASALAHPVIFAGENALANSVYYLALPNTNIFGYYSYLADPHYIYHFDLGYEYLIDANDGAGGLYLYDFASSHWWYTGRTYPFPYLYDFTLNAFLYYFPDTKNPQHYTTSPRFFYNFTASQIVTIPSAVTAAPAVGYLGRAERRRRRDLNNVSSDVLFVGISGAQPTGGPGRPSRRQRRGRLWADGAVGSAHRAEPSILVTRRAGLSSAPSRDRPITPR